MIIRIENLNNEIAMNISSLTIERKLNKFKNFIIILIYD